MIPHPNLTPATWPTDETVECPDCHGDGHWEDVRGRHVCAICAGDKRVPLETAEAYTTLHQWKHEDARQWFEEAGWCLEHRVPLDDFECVICDAEVAEARRAA